MTFDRDYLNSIAGNDDAPIAQRMVYDMLPGLKSIESRFNKLTSKRRIAPIKFSVSLPDEALFDAILEAKKLDNDGRIYKATAWTVAEVLVSFLFNDDDDRANLLTLPTQSSKSSVKQLTAILLPIVHSLLFPTEPALHALVMIPNFLAHQNTMVNEMNVRAALLSPTNIALVNKKLNVNDFLNRKVGVIAHSFGSVAVFRVQGPKGRIVDEHGTTTGWTDSDVVTLVSRLTKKLNVVLIVDESHRGSGFDSDRQSYQRWPHIINRLRQSVKRVRVIYVTATPTEMERLLEDGPYCGMRIIDTMNHIRGYVDSGYRCFFWLDRYYRMMPGAEPPTPLKMVDMDRHFGVKLSPTNYDLPFNDEHMGVIVDFTRKQLKKMKQGQAICYRLPGTRKNQANIQYAVYDALVESVGSDATIIVLNGSSKLTGSIAETVDNALKLGKKKVVLLVVEMVQMAHRYSKHIILAIDFKKESSQDETSKQGLAGRLTGYYKDDCILALSTDSLRIHQTIAEFGQAPSDMTEFVEIEEPTGRNYFKCSCGWIGDSFVPGVIDDADEIAIRQRARRRINSHMAGHNHRKPCLKCEFASENGLALTTNQSVWGWESESEYASILSAFTALRREDLVRSTASVRSTGKIQVGETGIKANAHLIQRYNDALSKYAPVILKHCGRKVLPGVMEFGFRFGSEAMQTKGRFAGAKEGGRVINGTRNKKQQLQFVLLGSATIKGVKKPRNEWYQIATAKGTKKETSYFAQILRDREDFFGQRGELSERQIMQMAWFDPKSILVVGFNFHVVTATLADQREMAKTAAVISSPSANPKPSLAAGGMIQ